MGPVKAGHPGLESRASLCNSLKHSDHLYFTENHRSWAWGGLSGL